MNLVARLVGILALGLTLIPPALFAAGKLADAPMKTAMLAGAVLWFVAAPLWLKGGE
ncbi:MAG: hypothetical protein IAE82_10345 [Opitutaceae bacterium]|nr:hypothetical protein [Opitutaceae bacterium]